MPSNEIPECIKNSADPVLAETGYILGRTEGALVEARAALQHILSECVGGKSGLAKRIEYIARCGLQGSKP